MSLIYKLSPHSDDYYHAISIDKNKIFTIQNYEYSTYSNRFYKVGQCVIKDCFLYTEFLSLGIILSEILLENIYDEN